ncbi:ICOS ligand isoform X2 [Monodelphis domestica]|uniref:ICOS ligand isoform X2 n=1 Tax=Monodelphis domestica TaxID=13616 RepID=UPI00044346BD|nr:ICOS ligand isoform X2 [Monodelphis domestica]
MSLKRTECLLLFLAALRAVIMKEIHGMVGDNVELSCISPIQRHFDLQNIHVYWQTTKTPPESVKSYIPGENSSQYDDSKYKNRASLTPEKMERGDFSLLLSNITTKDEQEFVCIVLNKSSFGILLQSEVTLRVAANFSVPVVAQETNNTEVTFTCTSHNGFPEPKVYWVNKTDNSLLNHTLQTVTKNEKGLFSVYSVLTIEWTPNISIECCIENVNLQQNLTVWKGGNTGQLKFTTIPNEPRPPETTSNTALFIIIGILFVVLVAAIISRQLCKKRHHYGHYTGPQRNTEMAEAIDYS